MRSFIIFLCLAAGGFCLTSTGSENELVMNDLNGVARRPLNPADKQASVLVFFWQDCPISNGYVPELNRIAAGRTNFAFYIVQVDPQLLPDAARQHSRQFDLHLPVLLDPQHRLVRLAGAEVTPEAVVFGKGGKILYHGRIDDNYASLGKKRAAARRHDLIEALDDIAAGRDVREKQTKAIGCTIQ